MNDACKTTLVKSISGSVGAPVAYWQITEFTNSESIKEVFAAANQRAPMILVIEDIDSMPDSCRSYFLNTLDGATSKEGIYLIGTTNYPEKIDAQAAQGTEGFTLAQLSELYVSAAVEIDKFQT
jgi:AAA+ superfamily predicted ATPase